MNRPIEPRDLPALRAMGFAWEFGEDFLCGMVYVDEADNPLMVAGAWQKAEVHMGSAKFSTPAARWGALQQLHRAMETELHRRNIREVITFFARCDRFCRRMLHLNWCKSDNISYHREVRP